MREKEEYELINRIKNSDKQAFELLFTTYYKFLCRFAYMITKNKESAEEIVQTLFVQLWEMRKNLLITTNVKNYLCVSLRNMCVNYLKKEIVTEKREKEYFVNSLNDSNFNEENFKQKLTEALYSLPEKCRTVYYLKNMEGLTHKEIAEYLDISEKTIENHITKALKYLRELLSPYKSDFYSK